MNDVSDTHTSNTGSTLMGFALGAAIGAGLALLLAPDSGRNTRRRLASKARSWGESAGRTLEQARDTVVELGIDAKSAIKVGQDAFVNDRTTREARSERGTSHAGGAAPGLNSGRSGEEAAR